MSTEPPSVASILQQQSAPPPPPSPHASGFDNLTCQWQGCGERCASPEGLYEHVCERHVGRKSTNNLNLQCQWGSCRTTTVKRDHITSHIRVHVPLKPHKCEFCGKSFKRPQDLKKHVKTHADDSVLTRSPDGASALQRGGPMPGYQQGTPRDASMYGGGAPPAPQPGYNYPTGSAAQAQMGQGGGNYGPVYYSMPQTGYAGLALTEQRKRQHDTLDAFFGDIKRRQLDPSQYFDLGAQFGGMQGLPMFAEGSYGNGYQNGYHQNTSFGGGDSGDVATTQMTVPPVHNFDTNFNNLKSKNDLMSIDQFLEQLQKTVYEHSATVAVGRETDTLGRNGQPYQVPTGTVDPQLEKDRESPPGSSISATDSSNTSGFTSGSHISSHSPASVHSHHTNVNPTTGYPSLPSVGAMANQQMGNFMQQPSGMPPNGLGNAYEDESRGRRYSGGYLQRAKPSSPQSHHSDESRTSAGDKEGITKDMKKTGLNSPIQNPPKVMEPSLKGGSGDNSDGSNAQDERVERWVQNMRTIEALRRYVYDRLQNGEFENGSPTSDGLDREDGNTTPKANSPRDYPMEDVKSVAYPTLRNAQST